VADHETDAEFLFVPAEKVMTVVEREGAIPYDVKGVELGAPADSGLSARFH
jgi:hypothetical protein